MGMTFPLFQHTTAFAIAIEALAAGSSWVFIELHKARHHWGCSWAVAYLQARLAGFPVAPSTTEQQYRVSSSFGFWEVVYAYEFGARRGRAVFRSLQRDHNQQHLGLVLVVALVLVLGGSRVLRDGASACFLCG